MQETGVWSLGQEAPLEEGMATHSSVLVWRTPWAEEPGGVTIHGGLKRVGRNEWLSLSMKVDYLKKKKIQLLEVR